MITLSKIKLHLLKKLLKSEGFQIHPQRQVNLLTILNDFWGNEKSAKFWSSINGNNEPIPWFTYPCIEYISQLDLKDKIVLEWGMGNSTLFFSKRCKTIDSIEHNVEWFNKIREKLSPNSFGHLVTEDEYSKFPFTLKKKFDLIIVDGIKRKACLENAVDLVIDNGIIIFDNSDRNPEYCKLMREKGFLQVDFHGFGPIVNFTTSTTIFFKRDFDFQPLTVQPVIPLGGGY